MVALYSGKTDMMAAMGKRSTRVRETLAVLLFRHCEATRRGTQTFMAAARTAAKY